MSSMYTWNFGGKAALLRDQIFELREVLLFKDVDSDKVPVWEKDRILAEQDVGYHVPENGSE